MKEVISIIIVIVNVIVILVVFRLSWFSKLSTILVPDIISPQKTMGGRRQYIRAPCQATLHNQYYLHHNISRIIPECFLNSKLQDLPQNVTFGAFSDESAYPFLSSDIWADVVDNERTFFVREYEDGFFGYSELKKWIASRKHPITLIFNNNIDVSWPANLEAEDWKEILREPNLHALFAWNLRKFDSDEFKSKVYPLPLGPKWQYQSTNLFGESKSNAKALFSSVSNSPAESEQLFHLPNRTNTVWVRPMSNSNLHTNNYEKSNPALSTPRSDVAKVLMVSAPNTTVLHSEGDMFLDQGEYFKQLKTHRFLANPAGNGLDTHSTWEALLAGCIPINPHSALDSLYDGLPVWLVNDWEEVTDDTVRSKAQEMGKLKYDWSLVFSHGWENKIYDGLHLPITEADMD